MVAQARQRLSDDHNAVGELLKELMAALYAHDLRTSYFELDLFWARLAVHIRAEHLHLFPAVMSALEKGNAQELNEARAIIENLRSDHDFFMHELARAIAILRELKKTTRTPIDQDLGVVRGAVGEVERRLSNHNLIEEAQIYLWSSTLLTEPEQFKLLAEIRHELDNRPPRFSEKAWTFNY